MLALYPVTVATPHSRLHWTAFAFAIVFSLGYGVLAGRRIRRTVIASDENGYTLRVEKVGRTKTR
jgi:hypothetical protein